jgi:hypothetical protein
MSKVEILEKEIETLSRQELSQLREWFIAFDADAWDRIMRSDAAAGKLDELAADAIQEHQQGKSEEL